MSIQPVSAVLGLIHTSASKQPRGGTSGAAANPTQAYTGRCREQKQALSSGFPCCGGRTLEQVMVEWWVGRKYSCHLVVIRRMYVFINTVACELHLPGDGRIRHVIGLSRVGGGKGREDRPGVPQARIMRGQDSGLSLQLTPWPNAKVEMNSFLQSSGLCP